MSQTALPAQAPAARAIPLPFVQSGQCSADPSLGNATSMSFLRVVGTMEATALMVWTLPG